MKRPRRPILARLVAGLALYPLLCASTVAAHPPAGHVTSAFQFPQGMEPVIDGHLEDWALLGSPTLTTSDFVDLVNGATPDDGDLAIQAWLGWSPETGRLYVAAEVRDDIHQIDRPNGSATSRIFLDDDLEVFVDGDHSGGQYADFDGLSDAEMLALNGAQASHFVLGGPHPDGDYFVNFSAASWYALVDGSYTAAAINFDGVIGAAGVTRFEMSLAVFDEINMTADFLSRRHLLRAGEHLGFNLEVSDFDARVDLLDAKWSLSGGQNGFRLAQRFGDLALLPLEDRFRPTAVREATWARIKSSFAP